MEIYLCCLSRASKTRAGLSTGVNEVNPSWESVFLPFNSGLRLPMSRMLCYTSVPAARLRLPVARVFPKAHKLLFHHLCKLPFALQ